MIIRDHKEQYKVEMRICPRASNYTAATNMMEQASTAPLDNETVTHRVDGR